MRQRRASDRKQKRSVRRTILLSMAMLAAGGSVASESHASSQSLQLNDFPNGFKFPLVLCRTKVAALRDVSGHLVVVSDQYYGHEIAFPVKNVEAMNVTGDDGRIVKVFNGDFDGTYDLPDTRYRLRFDGHLQQSLEANGTHEMRLRTYLEKKKPLGGGYLEVGQNTAPLHPAQTQSDGRVWENVYSYTFNSYEMKQYLSQGRPDNTKILDGIRDGKLNAGSVFAVLPVCGFLDAVTVKENASDATREKYLALFDSIPDLPPETVVATRSEPTSSKQNQEAHSSGRDKQDQDRQQVADSEYQDSRREFDPNYDQRNSQAYPSQADAFSPTGPQPTAPGKQAPGQQMSPQMQAYLARQNAEADAAAQAYNQMSQQGQQQGMYGDPSYPQAAGQQDMYGDAAYYPQYSNQQINQAPVNPGAPGMMNPNVAGMIPPGAQPPGSVQAPDQMQQQMDQHEQQQSALWAQQDPSAGQQQAAMEQQQADSYYYSGDQNGSAPQATGTGQQAGNDTQGGANPASQMTQRF